MSSQRTEADGRIKVIYIMGSGRSGSTLLSIILGNHPELVGPGEITYINRLKEENFTCSCGDRVETCNFWSKVFSEWKEKSGAEGVSRTMENIRKVEDFRSLGAWIRAVFNYPGRKEYFRDYLENSYVFLRGILENSGKSALVDISKNPLRAYILSKHPMIDLRLIHLVRDGRGVAWSLNKFVKEDFPQKPVWRTAFFWSIVNRQSNYVRKRVMNAELIRYEDLIENPEETLKAISKLSDIDSAPLLRIIDGELAQDDTHIMAGNKLRRAKSIKLTPDIAWKENLSASQLKTFSRISGRMLRKFGYR